MSQQALGWIHTDLVGCFSIANHPTVMNEFYHSGSLDDTSDPTANTTAGPSFDSIYDTALIQDVHTNAGHWINTTGHEPMEEPKAAPRRRRPSGDHVKHRRTRNGCYTCRSRRVKVELPVSMLSLTLLIQRCLDSAMKYGPYASVSLIRFSCQ